MYDIYKTHYNTLPNLKKLQKHHVFERNRTDSTQLQKEKQDALLNQTCCLEYQIKPEIYTVCEQWLIENYPFALKNTRFLDIAKEIDEDLLIHRIDGDHDFLSCAHVCLPSHWRPEDKIGLSFKQIHQPVPMNLNNSRKLLEAIVYGGIFERFVWSVVYENKYNFHPNVLHKSFDKYKPQVFIKVERQVTVGFPEQHFCLFILRQYLIPEQAIDKPILADVINIMTAAQKHYKGLADCSDLLAYLQVE